ncbi:hypothetical protein, partial [Acaryochloris sp. IP29b_bin.148]|uniref:hypothetical protein n=1 Tax=Acaryochloris sp. IP29b_bin.148 TaxID=2969218 RepID=UPI0026365D68
ILLCSVSWWWYFKSTGGPFLRSLATPSTIGTILGGELLKDNVTVASIHGPILQTGGWVIPLSHCTEGKRISTAESDKITLLSPQNWSHCIGRVPRIEASGVEAGELVQVIKGKRQ